ncbi:MAG: tail fiber domain-containing protein [Holophagales bacterium]|nr:tail fiber domain-containing protein [Holophagales bacterium]
MEGSSPRGATTSTSARTSTPPPPRRPTPFASGTPRPRRPSSAVSPRRPSPERRQRLGTASSRRRPRASRGPTADLGDPSPLLLSLRPVSFVYRKDETRTPQVGLIAEEVETVAPALVVRDENGVVTSVRYDQLVPLLLAEAQRLERENDGLKRVLEELSARVQALEEPAGPVSRSGR